MENLIEFKNVYKSFNIVENKKGFIGFLENLVFPNYRTINAVKDINLSIKPGEIVGYIGPNGAGKSTTIKMIAGVMKPTSGEILVAGREPSQNRIIHQLEIGVVLGQRSRLLWDLPVRESFLYQGFVYRIPRKNVKERIDETVDLFDIGSFFDQPARFLSLGQRMRCEIALNFLHKPRILLLDEPTIGLDIDAKASLRKAILDSARLLNTTIILTSHDLGDVEVLSNRIVILNQGQIIFDGTVERLRSNYQIPSVIYFRTDAHVMQAQDWLSKYSSITQIATKDKFIAVSYIEDKITSAQIVNILLQKTTIYDFYTSKPSIEEVLSAVYKNQDIHN